MVSTASTTAPLGPPVPPGYGQTWGPGSPGNAGPGVGATNHAPLPTGWRALVAQVAFVFGAALIAGTSDQAATVMLTLMVALGVLWAINRYGS